MQIVRRGMNAAGLATVVVLLVLPARAEETNAIPAAEPNPEVEVAAAGNTAETADLAVASRLTVGARVGDSIQEYFGDALLPVWVTQDAAWFGDLRGTLLEDREQEVNLGVVDRRLLSGRDLILGVNLFGDVRWTEADNSFTQVGGGVEALSTWVDARANYYYPLDDEQVLSESTDTVTSSGVTTTSRIVEYEEALAGFDAELGAWLPYLSPRVPTALFAGYYDFTSDVGDDFSGPKLRLESRVHRHVILDAEWFDDAELNQTDYFVGIRVTFAGDKAPVRERVLADRMNDMVQRDFRIRTIQTGPIVADTVSRQATTRNTSTRTSSSPSASPPKTDDPDTGPGNCFLDSEGNVVCK